MGRSDLSINVRNCIFHFKLTNNNSVEGSNFTKLQTGYTDYKNGILPRNIFLRNWFGNMWPIGVTKTEKDIYFEYGWKKFIEANIVERGDFFILYYDGTRIFYFKLFGRNGCEKKGVGGLKLIVKEEEAEEMNVEHQKSVEPKMNTRARDSKNISSSDVRDENNMRFQKKMLIRKKKTKKKKKMMMMMMNTKRGGRERKDWHIQQNDTAFQSYMQKCDCWQEVDVQLSQKNPYFVIKIHPNRRNHLYVMADAVKDYQLELPSRMTNHDSPGKEFEAKLKIWQDGRIWLIGGWHSLCKWNFVEKNDKCICEFVREKYIKGLYLQVHVVHEGEGNHLGLVFEIIFTQKSLDAAHHLVPLIGHATCQIVHL
ncbi:hypothetical protein H5410_028133, partial [Solanum commersonii]